MKTNNKWIICRTCLKQAGDFKDIFDHQNETTEGNDNLAKKISLCGGIQLDEMDGLPSKICQNCFLRLKVSWKFRTQCKQTEQQLQLMASRVKAVAQSFTANQSSAAIEKSPLKVKEESICDKQVDVNEITVGEEGQEIEDFGLEFEGLHNEEAEFLNLSAIETDDVVAMADDDNCESYECIEIDSTESVKSVEFVKSVGDAFSKCQKGRIRAKQTSLGETNDNYVVNFLQTKEDNIAVDTSYNTQSLPPYQMIEMQLPPSLNATFDDEHIDEVQQITFEPMESVEESGYTSVKEEFEFLVDDSAKVSAKNSETPSKKSAKVRGAKHKLIPQENSVDKRGNSFICFYCGNIYKQKAKLTVHLKSHTNDKKHECEICHKRFTQTPQLHRHMNTHTGNRPFGCQYCTAKFADPSTCLKHERIHTKERPFKCSVCGKGFSYSHVLKVHERIHSGEKPYECSVCNKRFSQSHHMRSHKKRTHSKTNSIPFTELSEKPEPGCSEDNLED